MDMVKVAGNIRAVVEHVIASLVVYQHDKPLALLVVYLNICYTDTGILTF